MKTQRSDRWRVLILEDLSTDVELARREVNKALPGCEIRAAEDEPGFISALKEFDPHLVISDYRLPSYDGLTALKHVLKHFPFTPVIILTGSMNEDTAVECMKAGAVDYVIKEHVKRLGPAIENALKHRALMIEREEAEKKLIKSELMFRNLFTTHSAAKLIIDPESGTILDANPAASEFYGWSIDELRSKKIGDLNTLPQQEINRHLKMANDERKEHFNFIHRKADGSVVDIEAFTSRVEIGGKIVLHSIIHDVSEKRKAEKQLRLLSHAIEQSPIPVLITDSSGKIEYVNIAFTSSLGYTISELKEKDANFFNSGLESPELFKNMWDTILEGKNWSGQLRNRTKSGDLIWENLMIAPILDSSGNIEHFVAFREDITEKVKMVNEIIAAKEKAEEMVKLKSEFYAAMSHELRTPFIGILGFAEILLDMLTDPEMRHMVENIMDSTKRITRTLTGILRIIELDSNRNIIFPSPVNIAAVIEKNISDLAPLIAKKVLTVETDVESLRKDFILDARCVDDIVAHLISNAVNFSERGKIIITGSKTGNGKGQYLKLEVSDNGIGIPHEMHKSIWDEFRQVSGGYSRSHEGLGLGLAIVKRSVDLLGGSVSVQSETGKGSRFTVKLPVSISDRAPVLR